MMASSPTYTERVAERDATGADQISAEERLLDGDEFFKSVAKQALIEAHRCE